MTTKHKQPRFLFVAFFAVLLLSACKPKQMVQHLADADVSYLRLSEGEALDAEIEAFIAPYRAKMAKEMDVVVGTIDQELKKQRPNSNMGNWFTDLLEDSAKETFPDTKIDFAVQNYGGLRLGSIPAGDITAGKIFELMPFDNTLVCLELDAKTIQQLVDRIAEYGGWPISRSLAFTIRDSAAVDIKIKNEALNPNIKYQVVMPDYIANGGDNCHFLKDKKRQDSGVVIRQVLIKYLSDKMAEGISPAIDDTQRIKTN